MEMLEKMIQTRIKKKEKKKKQKSENLDLTFPSRRLGAQTCHRPDSFLWQMIWHRSWNVALIVNIPVGGQGKEGDKGKRIKKGEWEGEHDRKMV